MCSKVGMLAAKLQLGRPAPSHHRHGAGAARLSLPRRRGLRKAGAVRRHGADHRRRRKRRRRAMAMNRDSAQDGLLPVLKRGYPPGNQHIPPGKKENHLENGLFRGYVWIC